MSKAIESDFLPHKESVIARAVPFQAHDDAPFVYVLMRDAQITYVGQTTTPMFRIGTHSKTKRFDSYFLIRTNPELLNEFEAEAIVKYNPLENLTLPTQGKYITHRSAAKKYGAWAIKNAAKNGLIRKFDLHIGPVYCVEELSGLDEVREAKP